ncbi:MAG: PLP-dependent transferase [Actinomycetales bacterium]|uniref:homocysteine desulfhydrase n=1 Tax=Candidatus Phosphoribacter hodrii TaxID=2953743 RepID=A0A935MIA7_9MICO|nr:PLP-dependent transferase [Candidatus Phosphoribacter hodrii]HOR16275.1 PLP-dependent transferase [Dermatophilaceae bacterium]
MTDLPPDLAPATVVVAAGRPPRSPGAPINPPIELSSTYAAHPATGPDGVALNLGYGRASNATWAAFEAAVGTLEGGDALCFASGMAAISAALTVLPADGPLVAPLTPYNTSGALIGEVEAAGREIRRVDVEDTVAVIAALHGARAIWLESPTNPLMQVADLPVIIAEAAARGVVVVVDNTFATPLVQQPLALGADIVVHSATKYLSGHSDLLMGVTVTRAGTPDAAPDRWYAALLAHRTRHGAIAGPFEAWLALRGIRTLHVRHERACANAAELARRLGEHPSVSRVRYPGWGAMLAIEVAGSALDAERVASACQVWLGATSLGGVESLIERRRRYPGESVLVPESLLRLSVGIEDVEDLWRDLDHALRA